MKVEGNQSISLFMQAQIQTKWVVPQIISMQIQALVTTLALAWQKNGFVYWQFGLRYNNAVYGFNSVATSKDTGDLKVQALDIPLTVGINFLSFTKIASLRAFISAMPSFRLGVSDNHFGVTKDDVNSFIFYGQIGIGANLAFVLIDVGYNYGFEGLMKNFSNTKPSQWFLSLGIKF